MTEQTPIQLAAELLLRHHHEYSTSGNLLDDYGCDTCGPVGPSGIHQHQARELDKAGLLTRGVTLRAIVNRLVDASPVRLTIGRGGPAVSTATVRPDGTADLAVDAEAARELGLVDGGAISVTALQPDPDWGVRYTTDGHVVTVHPNTQTEAERYAALMRVNDTDVEVVCRPRSVAWTAPTAEGGEPS